MVYRSWMSGLVSSTLIKYIINQTSDDVSKIVRQMVRTIKITSALLYSRTCIYIYYRIDVRGTLGGRRKAHE